MLPWNLVILRGLQKTTVPLHTQLQVIQHNKLPIRDQVQLLFVPQQWASAPLELLKKPVTSSGYCRGCLHRHSVLTVQLSTVPTICQVFCVGPSPDSVDRNPSFLIKEGRR